MKHLRKFNESDHQPIEVDIPEVTDDKLKIVLKFIVDNAKSESDLKWKLNKFIERGDVSFLGHSVRDLKMLLKASEEENNIEEND